MAELSDQAIQLINELWDVMSMVHGRELSGLEMKVETEIGSRTMEEYEHFLRHKLLKYRTIWRDGKSRGVYDDQKPQMGGEGDYYSP